MMPVLGKYAGVVLGAYGLSLALIVVLILATLWRGAKTRQALREVEDRQGKTHG